MVQTGYGEREGQAPRALDIEAPAGTAVAGGCKAALVSAFLAQHNDGPNNQTIAGRDAREPISTLSSKGAQQQVVSAFIKRDFGTSTGSAASDPIGTITTEGNGHASLVAAFMQKVLRHRRAGRAGR
jgi:DNA (cytosine-5)-methyltransferase 1